MDDFGIIALENLNNIKVDCVIITVSHDLFKKMRLQQLKDCMTDKSLLIYVRGVFSRETNIKGLIYRTL